MQRRHLSLLGLPIAACLITSCAGTPSDAYVIDNDPGSVEHVEGSDLGRVTLTGGAADRLQIETTSVTRAGRHLAVPDEAVFVDPDGVWWVYVNPESGVYVRHEIGIDRHLSGQVLLTSGPKAGTKVVTVGVPELYGIEAEVGH